jgi:flagellar motility protein MotE (MotC chaperone)
MLKNLKSLFIIEEEKPQKDSGKQAEPPEKQPSGPVTAKPKGGEEGHVNKAFIEVLLNAMEKSNLQGFDYMEYKQSLNSLKKMPLDEPTRYQSAFAMAQTMGATPENLILTAEHYLDILKEEERKFEEALVKQKQERIGGREQEIKKIEGEVKAKAEEIKKLTGEIEAQQKQIESLRKEIAESAVKVETTGKDFTASYNSLAGQIRLDVENMKKYLK